MMHRLEKLLKQNDGKDHSTDGMKTMKDGEYEV